MRNQLGTNEAMFVFLTSANFLSATNITLRQTKIPFTFWLSLIVYHHIIIKETKHDSVSYACATIDVRVVF
jgi:hypothetical protein